MRGVLFGGGWWLPSMEMIVLVGCLGIQGGATGYGFERVSIRGWTLSDLLNSRSTMGKVLDSGMIRGALERRYTLSIPLVMILRLLNGVQ